jgi:uncharacterized protein YndB with AHSA1/START domain
MKLPEFKIVSELDAQRELVYKAWTEAERMEKWWGPVGFQLTVARLELKPGGIFLYRMTSGTGQVWWGRFIFHVIAAPERLEYTGSFSDEYGGLTRHPLAPSWPLEMRSTALLEDLGGRTRLTVSVAPCGASPDECAVFAAGFKSMEGGYGGTLKQLEEYLKSVRTT